MPVNFLRIPANSLKTFNLVGGIGFVDCAVDCDIVIINKPVGMLSQKADAKDVSVVEYLINYLLDSGQITAEELRSFKPSVCSRLDRNTSGLLVCGKSLHGLQKMAEICIANNVLMVSDEIHSDLIFHGKKHIPTATVSEEIGKHIISCISGTKTFNLAGLQASTTVFPNADIKKKFDAFWMNMDIHRNNAFSSVAMEIAFNQGEEWLEQLLEYLDGNFELIRSYCAENIPQIKPNIPDATYLVWLDCRDLGMDNETLRRFMIEKAGLGLNEGYTFGRSLSGYMRLNAACPRSVLGKALGQLKAAVDALNK